MVGAGGGEDGGGGEGGDSDRGIYLSVLEVAVKRTYFLPHFLLLLPPPASSSPYPPFL